jgi:DEAD/DEAH box helicase domain-containing protein
VIIFFDLETQKLAAEVGGWSNIEALRVAVACTFDDDNGYRDWWESQAGDLLEELERAQLIVGYNINMFDFRVLSPYGSIAKLEAKAFDIMDELWQQTHKRVSLNTVAVLNLGEAKTPAGRGAHQAPLRGLGSARPAVGLWPGLRGVAGRAHGG